MENPIGTTKKAPVINPEARLAEKHTMKRSITAFCYQCMGRAASWRKDVKNCTAPQCPLYGFRPGKAKKETP